MKFFPSVGAYDNKCLAGMAGLLWDRALRVPGHPPQLGNQQFNPIIPLRLIRKLIASAGVPIFGKGKEGGRERGSNWEICGFRAHLYRST